MPTSTNVTNLKINELTEAQYDAAVQGGIIGANEISILTDVEGGQVIQVSTMPTASATEEGKIYQFVGTTDANYTNGYFYKCEGAGSPVVYSWTRVDVQPTPSGLPSQTGNAGKFLTTDGTDASWGTTINGAYKNIVTLSGYVTMFESVDNSNNSKFLIAYSGNGYSGSIIFRDSDANYKSGFTFINNGSSQKQIYPIGTGFSFGNPYAPWKNIYTKKLNNGADITVPTTGGTMAVIGVNTTITLASANWSSNTQTVNVTGMTATGVVMVSPDPTDQSAYTSAGILCTAQAAGTLTFTCDTVPSGDIDVNVVML